MILNSTPLLLKVFLLLHAASIAIYSAVDYVGSVNEWMLLKLFEYFNIFCETDISINTNIYFRSRPSLEVDVLSSATTNHVKSHRWSVGDFNSSRER